MLRATLPWLSLLLLAVPAFGQDADLAKALQNAADLRVFAADSAEMKAHHGELKRLRDKVNQDDRAAWNKITTKAEWEAFRDRRIAELRKLLGPWHKGPNPNPKSLVTKKIEGDGFVIENVVYEGHRGYFVTANLYSPAKRGGAMPGFVIVHSHHNAKTQGELQDMGINWAKRGCLVLIPDMLGHGERRQHPFTDAKSYPEPFKVGRQDYYFRYNVNLQLSVVDETLIGWMASDLMNGVSLLLNKPGVDAKKIILLGSVAGGGDPAAVTAALDSRITAVAPFNFGGPQPETKYPLPDDAETSFNYFGSGYWESTRNLVRSGSGGYLPWVIVGAVAPRGLIYGHEFAWDRERDPVWKRLEKIYGFYDAKDKLSFATGRGGLSGRPPEATHCDNIGPEHRKPMYPTLQKWFGIAPPETENAKRYPGSDLVCLNDEARKQFDVKPLHDFLANGKTAARESIFDNPRWQADAVESKLLVDEVKDGVTWQRFMVVSKNDPLAAIPVLWLKPAKAQAKEVVVAFALEGKASFLMHHAETISLLLKNGVSVCLPDLRGTGELRLSGAGRGRTSESTSISATLAMHGRAVCGQQFFDLQCVLAMIAKHDYRKAALWGESFAAPTNERDSPHDVAKPPRLGEPGAALLALYSARGLSALKPCAVCARGSITHTDALLESPFLHLPHDAIAMIRLAGLEEFGGGYQPARGVALLLEGCIDGLNRRYSQQDIGQEFTRLRKHVARLHVRAEMSTPAALAEWFTHELRRDSGDTEDKKR